MQYQPASPIPALPSKTLSFISLLTLSLVYAKLESDFLLNWLIVLSPLLCYYFWSAIEALIHLISFHPDATVNSLFSMKQEIVWRFHEVIIDLGLFGYLFWIGQSNPKQLNDFIQVPITYLFLTGMLIEQFFCGLLYSKYQNQELEQYIAQAKEQSSVIKIIINQIFTMLGTALPVCSGGACSSVYVSAITSFFSAFGISVTTWLPYIKYSTFGLILFSLLSLYSAGGRSIKYPPFILGLFGSISVGYHIIFNPTSFLYIFVGNFGIIIAAFWNWKKQRSAPLSLIAKTIIKKEVV